MSPARWVRWVGGLSVVKVVVGLVGFVGVVALSTVPAAATYPPAGQEVLTLTGKWRMTLEMEVGRATPLLELTEKDGKLSGTYTGRYGPSPVEGTVEGRKLAFSVGFETQTLAFQGEIKDDGTLAGTASFGELGEVKWTAVREKSS